MKRGFVYSILLLVAAFPAMGQEKINEAVRVEQIFNLRQVVLPESQGSYTPDFKSDATDTKVRNVILMIGDGMGDASINAAMFANGGLTITNLHNIGFVRTQSADNFITDSSASATAYACGEKTCNTRMGCNPDGAPLPNIPERLAAKGLISGVVTTDDIDGATPSAFFAHQWARSMKAEIWGDVANSYLTFLAGGNYNYFKSQSQETQDAIEEVFTVTSEPDEWYALKNSSRLLYLPETVKAKDRGNYLPETTQMAIDYLNARTRKGFFLMVESARIDHFAHRNDLQGLVEEILDFDKAVEVALKFAEKDGHTLVLVTADHDTGSLTFRQSNLEEKTVNGVFSGYGHTGLMVPIFAFGPKSRTFSCVQENSDVSNKIVQLMTR